MRLREQLKAAKKELKEAERQRADLTKSQGTGEHTPVRVSLWVGALILAGLTIYLLVFYSSASYSAFFKAFTPDEIAWANAIFDAQAFRKAYRDGLAQLLLISLMPFVFLGLGYLVHKFREQQGSEGNTKIGVIIIVTLLFDALLAYEITRKTGEVTAQMAFESPPPYTPANAVANVEFWLIIFAGFVAYLIWGFVFDFTIEENRKRDVAGLALQSARDRIEALNARIQTLEEQITANTDGAQTPQDEEDATQRALDESRCRFHVATFMEGWLHGLGEARAGTEAMEAAAAVAESFLSSQFAAKNPSPSKP